MTGMTQPHYIDREAVARIIDPAAFMFSPGELADKVYSASRAHAFDRADRILALIAAPMEAVAWRENEEINWKAEWEAACAERIKDRERSQEAINERDKWIVELIRERDALQALAVIPTQGLGSSAEGADTDRAEDGAVVAEKDPDQ